MKRNKQIKSQHLKILLIASPIAMLKKLTVPTRLPKDYLLKYLDESASCALLPVRHKRKHAPHFSNVLCKFFARGSCSRGSDCIFSHDPSHFPCSDQLLHGKCCKASCLYSHDPCPDASCAQANAAPISEPIEEKKLFLSPFS